MIVSLDPILSLACSIMLYSEVTMHKKGILKQTPTIYILLKTSYFPPVYVYILMSYCLFTS